MFYTKTIAGTITVVIVVMLARELVRSVKSDKDGRANKKWDLD